MSDYIPARDADFNAWLKGLLSYVDAKVFGPSPAWPHVPAAFVDDLHRAEADWYMHYEATLYPHTPVHTAEKNAARSRAEAVARPFVQRFLHWPPVTDGDRVAMGVPNRDAVRTEHRVVDEAVEFELRLRNIREILVNFWVKGAHNRAKPVGYDGAVILWDVLDSPPERPEDLRRHRMASRTPHEIDFDETERGKRVYVALAWQNERGVLGQFSEIQNAVVP